MKVRITKGIIYGMLQALIFIGVYYLILTIALEFHTPRGMSISERFGYNAFKDATFLSFGIIMISFNIIIAISKSKATMWFLYSLVFIAFLYFHGMKCAHVPFKSLHYLTSGLIGLLSIIPIIEIDKKISIRRKPDIV